MIKTKEDARQWILEQISNEFEGNFWTLNELLEKNNIDGFYYWNANGARIIDGTYMKQIDFKELINVVYKCRKLINKYYKDLEEWAKC